MYQGELSFLRGYEDGYLLSQQALKANYWKTCGANLVAYPSCRSVTDPTQLAAAYLYQLQAWYGNTFSVLGWYTSSYSFIEDDQRERISQAELEGLNKRGWDKFVLLIPENINVIEGEIALKDMNYNDSYPWHWGNYGYEGEDQSTPYYSMRNEVSVVFCINNRKFQDNIYSQIPNTVGYVDFTDYWFDDIFVLTTTTSSAQTSTYDRNNMPLWVESAFDLEISETTIMDDSKITGCYGTGIYVRPQP